MLISETQEGIEVRFNSLIIKGDWFILKVYTLQADCIARTK